MVSIRRQPDRQDPLIVPPSFLNRSDRPWRMMGRKVLVGRSGSWSIRVAAPPAASSSPPAHPPELIALTAAARRQGTVTAWCRAGFRPAQANAFVAAMTSAAGGRYVALEPGVPATELGRFTLRADLSGDTRAQAEDLDRSIRQSSTRRQPPAGHR